MWIKHRKKINPRACYNRIWSWSPVPCEKHGPWTSITTKNLSLRPRFLSTEFLGPCFSDRMGDHDQILQQHILAYKQNSQLPVVLQCSTNITAIYSTGYYNKSLGVYYWCVKMPRRGCREHGLECIMFYVQKYIAHLIACSGPPAGSRRVARRALISETRLFKLLNTSYTFLLNPRFSCWSQLDIFFTSRLSSLVINSFRSLSMLTWRRVRHDIHPHISVNCFICGKLVDTKKQ